MIPNLYSKNGCFSKHPFKKWLFRVPGKHHDSTKNKCQISPNLNLHLLCEHFTPSLFFADFFLAVWKTLRKLVGQALWKTQRFHCWMCFGVRCKTRVNHLMTSCCFGAFSFEQTQRYNQPKLLGVLIESLVSRFVFFQQKYYNPSSYWKCDSVFSLTQTTRTIHQTRPWNRILRLMLGTYTPRWCHVRWIEMVRFHTYFFQRELELFAGLPPIRILKIIPVSGAVS